VRVLDRTYTCRVRPQHYVDVNTNVFSPSSATGGYPVPAELWLDTVDKTAEVGGLRAVVPQVRFQSTKNSLSVDQALCRRSSHRIALRPAGLPLYQTVTPRFLGKIETRCAVVKRVLVHFRITMIGGRPARALFVVGNDAAKTRPLEFIKWMPRKIRGYLGSSCVDTS
jgi:hypothetical protein